MLPGADICLDFVDSLQAGLYQFFGADLTGLNGLGSFDSTKMARFRSFLLTEQIIGQP